MKSRKVSVRNRKSRKSRKTSKKVKDLLALTALLPRPLQIKLLSSLQNQLGGNQREYYNKRKQVDLAYGTYLNWIWHYIMYIFRVELTEKQKEEFSTEIFNGIAHF